ncbi:MAG: lysophospholipid acyltransferase family protein, partial [Gammaproteobacteria bacterium]|nr:lysophospholipid acyltransferase family protein [Gammaproteobacteria bacterium]
SSPVKGAIAIAFLRMLSFLPLTISSKITAVIAWLTYYTNSSSRKTTEANLKLCYPNLSDKERDELTRKSIKASGKLMAETAKVWLRPAPQTLPMITDVEGEDYFHQLNNDPDTGTLLISPHLGNWELIWSYLAYNYQSSGLYRPPKIKELEKVILEGRRTGGGQIIKTTKMEVRKMLKVLKNAESLFLLPDQQPVMGSGVFAPFYGHQAYTMTLLQGLVQRTGAKILMVTCIRTTRGFTLSFSPVDIDSALTNEEYAEQLNLHLQQEIDKNPTQYEWAYKRFKASPEGTAHRY